MNKYIKNKENYINQIILKEKKKNIYPYTFLNNIKEYFNINIYYNLLNTYDCKYII